MAKYSMARLDGSREHARAHAQAARRRFKRKVKPNSGHMQEGGCIQNGHRGKVSDILILIDAS